MHSKKSPPKDPSPIRLLALSLRKTGARRATWKASSQASWFPLEASTIVERNKKDANMLFVTHRGIGIFTYVTWMVDLYGRSQVVQTLYRVCSTLPKTNSSKNWKLEWLEDDSSFWGPAYFGEESRRSWEYTVPFWWVLLSHRKSRPKRRKWWQYTHGFGDVYRRCIANLVLLVGQEGFPKWAKRVHLASDKLHSPLQLNFN